MIKYIKDFEKTTGSEQYDKMLEELFEAKAEYAAGEEEKEVQELCDLVQTVFTRFNQLSMTKEDIESAFIYHYIKESARGRIVADIEGTSKSEERIEILLNRIIELEVENKDLILFATEGYKDNLEEGIEV